MGNEITETKETIVGNLYSIRAGLSYISQLSDSYQEKSKAIADHEKKIEEYREGVNYFTRQKDEYIRSEENTKRKLEALEQMPISEVVKQARTENKGLIGRMIFYVIFAIISLTVFLAVGVENFPVGPMFAFFSMIFFFIGLIKYANKKKALRDKHKKEIEETRRYAQGPDPFLARSIKDLNGYKSKLDAEMKLAPTIAAYKQEVPEIRKKAKAVYDALVNAYGGYFHPENWKYIDRVVFYLTTDRADTIRDALNLMDQRLNAEMIASEMRACSQQIVGEIRRSTSLIVSAVSLASERIVESNNALTRELSAANQIASAQVDATNRLVSAQELNNALQKKANTSMEQLIKDYQVVNNRVHY